MPDMTDTDASLARGETARAQDMYEVALDTDPGHAYSQERLASISGGSFDVAGYLPEGFEPEIGTCD